MFKWDSNLQFCNDDRRENGAPITRVMVPLYDVTLYTHGVGQMVGALDYGAGFAGSMLN